MWVMLMMIQKKIIKRLKQVQRIPKTFKVKIMNNHKLETDFQNINKIKGYNSKKTTKKAHKIKTTKKDNKKNLLNQPNKINGYKQTQNNLETTKNTSFIIVLFFIYHIKFYNIGFVNKIKQISQFINNKHRSDKYKY